MLLLLKSYLSDRKHYVKVGNEPSCLNDILCGVPQGSVLGLFLTFHTLMTSTASFKATIKTFCRRPVFEKIPVSIWKMLIKASVSLICG